MVYSTPHLAMPTVPIKQTLVSCISITESQRAIPPTPSKAILHRPPNLLLVVSVPRGAIPRRRLRPVTITRRRLVVFRSVDSTLIIFLPNSRRRHPIARGKRRRHIIRMFVVVTERILLLHLRSLLCLFPQRRSQWRTKGRSLWPARRPTGRCVSGSFERSVLVWWGVWGWPGGSPCGFPRLQHGALMSAHCCR